MQKSGETESSVSFKGVKGAVWLVAIAIKNSYRVAGNWSLCHRGIML
jgi:hypothetical protein